MEQEKLLTTKEVADILGVTTATVLKYAKEGRLAPSKLFKEVDVLQLQKEIHKSGLTTGEAAEKLGVTLQTVKNFIKSGELSASKHLFRGREIYFISKDDFEKFDYSYTAAKKKGMKEFFLKEGSHTYDYGRIMDLGKGEKGYLKTEEGREIQLAEKEFDEFLADEDDKEKELMSKIYSILSVGAHNYDALNSVFKEEGNISIKPIRANFNSNEDEYNFFVTRSLLTSSIMKFTSVRFPEYKPQIQDFSSRIRPYLNIN